MINTVTVKPKNGEIFTLGGEGKEVVLIIGSCRSVPYANYFWRYNKLNGNPFVIRFFDPNDAHWSEDGTQVDFHAAINAMESNEYMLSVLRETTIFVHEFYRNYGMFNSDRTAEKNIYQFGMAPRLDITIPNFHDRFVLWNDLMTFDPQINSLKGREQLDYARAVGLAAIEKFCSICNLTSFPEMAEHFRQNWKRTRFFWTANHISKHFSLYIWKLMNEKFLHLNLTPEFWEGANAEDLYEFPCTQIAPQDIQNHSLRW